MSRLALPKPVRSILLSDAFWWLLPTPATAYLNRTRPLREPAAVPSLPASDWSQRERRALLISSEERLRNLEGKGPGLATISAIVVATVLVSIAGGWSESTTVAKAILVLAAVYAVLSLLMPLYLVGPLRRDTVHVSELEAAANADDPEETLAVDAAEAAMKNDLRNLRISNLLDAARRELSYSLILIVFWALLTPATGVLRRDTQSNSAPTKPTPGAKPG